MAEAPDIQEALAAVGEVLELIERQGGDSGAPVVARVRRSCALLASGDLNGLSSLLAETTGGMGSLNDYGFASDVDGDLRRRKNDLTLVAAEKCRIALRCRGIEPWR